MGANDRARILPVFLYSPKICGVPDCSAQCGAVHATAMQIAFDSSGLAAIECAPFEVYLLNFRNSGYENILR